MGHLHTEFGVHSRELPNQCLHGGRPCALRRRGEADDQTVAIDVDFGMAVEREALDSEIPPRRFLRGGALVAAGQVQQHVQARRQTGHAIAGDDRPTAPTSCSRRRRYCARIARMCLS